MCCPTSCAVVSCGATARRSGAAAARRRRAAARRSGAAAAGSDGRHGALHLGAEERGEDRDVPTHRRDDTCYTIPAARPGLHPAHRCRARDESGRRDSREQRLPRARAGALLAASRCRWIAAASCPAASASGPCGSRRATPTARRSSASPAGPARPACRSPRRTSSSCRPRAATSCCSTSAAPARRGCCAARASSATSRPASDRRRPLRAQARRAAVVLHERRLGGRHRGAARPPRRAADRAVRGLLRHPRRGRVRAPLSRSASSG